MSDGSYMQPHTESEWDRVHKAKSFKATYLADSGWYTVVTENDAEIDASGDGGFTEADAHYIANALNFYTKAQILNGNHHIR